MSQQDRESIQYNDDTPVLLVGYCDACGEHVFPPRDACPVCFSERTGETTVSKGRLETFVSVHTPKEGFPSPYTVGFVRITDDDLRVFSYITDPIEDCEIGQTVYVQSTSVGDFEETWAFGLEATHA